MPNWPDDRFTDLHRRVGSLEDWKDKHDEWAGDKLERLVALEKANDFISAAIEEIKESSRWQNRLGITTLLTVVGYFLLHAMGWVK